MFSISCDLLIVGGSLKAGFYLQMDVSLKILKARISHHKIVLTVLLDIQSRLSFLSSYNTYSVFIRD